MPSVNIVNYYGPVEQESNLGGLVLVADTADAPTASSSGSYPTYQVFNLSGSLLISGITHKSGALTSIVGAYGINHPIRASSSFAVGKYTGVVDYRLRGASHPRRRQGFAFDVV